MLSVTHIFMVIWQYIVLFFKKEMEDTCPFRWATDNILFFYTKRVQVQIILSILNIFVTEFSDTLGKNSTHGGNIFILWFKRRQKSAYRIMAFTWLFMLCEDGYILFCSPFKEYHKFHTRKFTKKNKPTRPSTVRLILICLERDRQFIVNKFLFIPSAWP